MEALPCARVIKLKRAWSSEMAPRDEQYPTVAQLADLSALADGSLDPSRREAVAGSIAASPQLRTLYERERAALEVLRQAATERAPARLRGGIEARRGARAVRTRWAGYAALAGAVAATAAALALLLPGGTPGAPSILQAAQLARRGPSGPAPAPDPADPRTKLAQRVQGLYFPNWSRTLGWRPVGARSDRLGGRPTVTVYYQLRGRYVAYSIVGAPALAQPSAPVTHLAGFELRVLSLGGRTIVTWRRAGHTCVLSATAVPTGLLEQLATWRTAGSSD
jgi:anti-sigma factor RsiW